MTEPRITINGTTLTEGQSMTVRVALSAFMTEVYDSLREPTEMDRAYRDRLIEIFRVMQV